MKKAIIALLVSTLILPALVFAQTTSVMTSTTFSTNLTTGSTGSDVTALQTWLISKGYSIPAGATGYFGTETQAAVVAYQQANGISPAVGYFGPITRASANALLAVYSPGTPTVTGCLPGAAFSSTTGEPCTTSPATPPSSTGSVTMTVPGSVTLTSGESATQNTSVGMVTVFTLDQTNTVNNTAQITVVTEYSGTSSGFSPAVTAPATLVLNEPQFVGGEIYTLNAVSAGTATIRVDTPQSVIPNTPYNGQTVPILSSVIPSAGPIGTDLTLNGSGFSSTTILHFGGYTFTPGYGGILINSAGTQMTFTIPPSEFSCDIDEATAPAPGGDCAGTTFPLQPGNYEIFLTQGPYTSTNLKSSSVSFTVTSQ